MAGLLIMILSLPAYSMIDGISGNVFNLEAKEGNIYSGEGGSHYMWGFSDGANVMQYPGPTMIINQGDMVTVNLTNWLSVPVSIIFPGQSNVTAMGGTEGLMAREAAPNGGMVSYMFMAEHPGTYMYQSGTNCELQIEMGLIGAIIIRPAPMMPMDAIGTNAMEMPMGGQAYDTMDSQYEDEYLFLLSELDPAIHRLAELGNFAAIDNAKWWPTIWFINGRCAPDTMLAANVPWLPNQPYNCMPMMHPGDRILCRYISAGRDLHPFHQHGNNFKIIARDGRLLQSMPGGMTADLAYSDFTITVAPGGTADSIFVWTGAGLGWDMYGHAPGDPLEMGEDPADHGKPFPVVLPQNQELLFGGMWSGSPFLGAMGTLPPGEGGMNPNAGYTFMWHSHNEQEMTNDDIFPGGLMTMIIIEAPNVPIMH